MWVSIIILTKVWIVGEWAGGWDGNTVKLGCCDCCTTINVRKLIE